jgi:hypothetical protein
MIHFFKPGGDIACGALRTGDTQFATLEAWFNMLAMERVGMPLAVFEKAALCPTCRTAVLPKGPALSAPSPPSGANGTGGSTSSPSSRTSFFREDGVATGRVKSSGG